MAAGTDPRLLTDPRLFERIPLEAVKRELARWDRVARPKQRRPPGARIWLLQTGRGWGKTRTAAEDLRLAILADVRDVLVMAPTWTEVQDVQAPMLLRVLDDLKPDYRRSLEAPTISVGNATIHLRSGQRPDRCRGLEVGYAWLDEFDHWKPEGMDAYSAYLAVVEPCIRREPAQQTVTSTPRRGGPLAKLIQRSDVVVTRGHTRENAPNLAAGTVDQLEAAYGGSWLARQELGGELVLDIAGAIVTHAMIEAARVAEHPELARIVVGVDPSGGTADQGIVAVGHGVDGDAYVLADRTCKLSPDGWGRRVVELYHALGADRVVAERNYGGDMVESTIRTVDSAVPLRLVTATRGKHVRFEPVGALYEQGRVHHVGALPELEDEVTAFTPDGYDGGASPNRADALVWAVTDLMLAQRGVSPADLYGDQGVFA